MVTIADPDASFIQFIKIGNETYIKYTSKDNTDYLVKNSDPSKPILQNKFSDVTTFNAMQILYLPSSSDLNLTQVGYLTENDEGQISYLQYELSSGKTTVNIDLFTRGVTQNIRWESWDANGLVDNVNVIVAYTLESQTFCFQQKGRIQSLTSFDNPDNYSFHNLYVSRGEVQNNVSILIPVGSSQKTQTQNTDVARIENGIVQNPPQKQSLGCYCISSNFLTFSPGNLNVTTFFPIDKTNNRNSKNFNISYQSSQATYDAQFISLLIQFSYDEVDTDGKTIQTVKDNLIYVSENGGIDFFPYTIPNNIYLTLDKKSVEINRKLQFASSFSSLIRLENSFESISLLTEPKETVETLKKGDATSNTIQKYLRANLENVQISSIPQITKTCVFQSPSGKILFGSNNGIYVDNNLLSSTENIYIVSGTQFGSLFFFLSFNGKIITYNDTVTSSLKIFKIDDIFGEDASSFKNNWANIVYSVTSELFLFASRTNVNIVQLKVTFGDKNVVSNITFPSKELIVVQVNGNFPYTRQNSLIQNYYDSDKLLHYFYYVSSSFLTKGFLSFGYITVDSTSRGNFFPLQLVRDNVILYKNTSNTNMDKVYVSSYDANNLDISFITGENIQSIDVIQDAFFLSAIVPTAFYVSDDEKNISFCGFYSKNEILLYLEQLSIPYSTNNSEISFSIKSQQGKDIFFFLTNNNPVAVFEGGQSDDIIIPGDDDDRSSESNRDDLLYTELGVIVLFFIIFLLVVFKSLKKLFSINRTFQRQIGNVQPIIQRAQNFVQNPRALFYNLYYNRLAVPLFNLYLRSAATLYTTVINGPRDVANYVGSVAQNAIEGFSNTIYAYSLNGLNEPLLSEEEEESNVALRSTNKNVIIPSIPKNNLPVYVQNYSVDFDGQEDYVTVGFIPSNVLNNRILSIVMKGTFKTLSVIEFDFSKVRYNKRFILLEGPISGTLTICKKVLNAKQYMKYNYEPKNRLLSISITLPFKIQDTSISFDITINDSSEDVFLPMNISDNSLNATVKSLSTNTLPAIVYSVIFSKLFPEELNFVFIAMYYYMTDFMNIYFNYPYPTLYAPFEPLKLYTQDEILILFYDFYSNDAYKKVDIDLSVRYALYNISNPFTFNLILEKDIESIPIDEKSQELYNTLPESIATNASNTMNVGNFSNYVFYNTTSSVEIVDLDSVVTIASIPTDEVVKEIITSPYAIDFITLDSKGITLIEQETSCTDFTPNFPLQGDNIQTVADAFVSIMNQNLNPFLENQILERWQGTISESQSFQQFLTFEMTSVDNVFDIFCLYKDTKYYITFKPEDRRISLSKDASGSAWMIQNSLTGNTTTITSTAENGQSIFYFGYNYALNQFIVTTIDQDGIVYFPNTSIYWNIQKDDSYGINQKVMDGDYILKNTFTNTVVTTIENNSVLYLTMSYASNNNLSTYSIGRYEESTDPLSYQTPFALSKYIPSQIMRNILSNGETLQAGNYIVSENGNSSFVIQLSKKSNKNLLVVYNNLTEQSIIPFPDNDALQNLSYDPTAVLKFIPESQQLFYIDNVSQQEIPVPNPDVRGNRFRINNDCTVSLLQDTKVIWTSTNKCDSNNIPVISQGAFSTATVNDSIHFNARLNTVFDQRIQTSSLPTTTLVKYNDASITNQKIVMGVSLNQNPLYNSLWHVYCNGVPIYAIDESINRFSGTLRVPIDKNEYCIQNKESVIYKIKEAKPEFESDSNEFEMRPKFSYKDYNIDYVGDSLFNSKNFVMKQNTLFRNQYIFSSNKQYKLGIDGTKLKIFYKKPNGDILEVWKYDSKTSLYAVRLDDDGFIKVYSVEFVETKISKNPGTIAKIQNDGNFVLRDKDGKVQWASNTNQDPTDFRPYNIKPLTPSTTIILLPSDKTPENQFLFELKLNGNTSAKIYLKICPFLDNQDPAGDPCGDLSTWYTDKKEDATPIQLNYVNDSEFEMLIYGIDGGPYHLQMEEKDLGFIRIRSNKEPAEKTRFKLLNSNGKIRQEKLTLYKNYYENDGGESESFPTQIVCSDTNIVRYYVFTRDSFSYSVFYAGTIASNQFSFFPNMVGNNFISLENDSNAVVPIAQTVPFRIGNVYSNKYLSVNDKQELILNQSDATEFRLSPALQTGYFNIFKTDQNNPENNLYWFYDESKEGKISLKTWDQNNSDFHAFRFYHNMNQDISLTTLQVWYQPYMFIETFSDSKTLRITSENGFDFQFIQTTDETFIQSEYNTKVFVSDPTLSKGIENVINNSEKIIPENLTIVLSNDIDVKKTL